MERHEKIYLPKISRWADLESYTNALKEFFNRLFPLAKPICLFVFVGFGWLSFQVFSVGVFDRFGISPKVSIPVSSLFYAVVFASLAVIGGLNNTRILKASGTNPKSSPICKILLIRRQKREIKI